MCQYVFYMLCDIYISIPKFTKYDGNLTTQYQYVHPIYFIAHTWYIGDINLVMSRNSSGIPIKALSEGHFLSQTCNKNSMICVKRFTL